MNFEQIVKCATIGTAVARFEENQAKVESEERLLEHVRRIIRKKKKKQGKSKISRISNIFAQEIIA